MDFELSEYRRRIEKTRKAMAARGIDLMIVVDPSNMAWLTGYDGWSFYVHQCVLLAPEGEPIWVGRGQDANGAKLTAFMDHEHIIGYPDNYVQSSERHPFDYVSQVIIEQRLGRKAHRRRDGQLLFQRRRLSRRWRRICRRQPSSTPTAW